MGFIFKDAESKHKAKFIWGKCWRPFFTLFFPLVLSVIFAWGGLDLNTKSSGKPSKPKELQPRAAFVVFLMACYWVSECLPLPATALLPIFLFPVLNIADTELMTSCYMNDSVLLLSSGCIIALAFEYSNLHTRIALKVATVVGAKIPYLLGGAMFTGMFLSMWMNNTSTTAMMVPIVYVIMEEFAAADLEDEEKEAARVSASEALEPKTEPEPPAPPETTKRVSFHESKSDKGSLGDFRKDKAAREARNIKIMFLLGIAYASNIGGTGIITGTATNVLADNALADKRLEIESGLVTVADKYKCLEVFQITFLNWFQFNVVPMIFSTIATWAVLLIWFTGVPTWMKCRKKTEMEKEDAAKQRHVADNIEKAMRAKYGQLGPMTLHEILVLIIFAVLVVLWMTGKIAKDIGWFYFFSEVTKDKNDPMPKEKKSTLEYPTPSTPAVFCCIIMLVLPKDKKYYKDFMKGGLKEGLNDPVLPWNEVEKKVPWGPLVLIGGGVAISRGISASGLNDAIGQFLANNETLKSLPSWVYLLVILIFVAMLTSIASNTATAAILSPVLIQLSMQSGVHPLYLLVTATVSASYAFMLPISTPPNAIVFDKSDMKQMEMMAPGSLITILTNVILFAMVHSYDELLFGFNEYALPKNQYCNVKSK